jgi:hypothetical protein
MPRTFITISHVKNAAKTTSKLTRTTLSVDPSSIVGRSTASSTLLMMISTNTTLAKVLFSTSWNDFTRTQLSAGNRFSARPAGSLV